MGGLFFEFEAVRTASSDRDAPRRYHPLDDGSRVVGFYVEPFTVKHKFANNAKWDGSGEAPPLSTCDKSGPMVYEAIAAKQDVQTGPVIFTYDVLWRASNVKWASRWDIYLSMDNAVRGPVSGIGVLRCLHAIDATRFHQTRSWVVSFSILRSFGPSRETWHSTRPHAGPGQGALV